ncbi:citronellol/citronellal dehydrogenase [Rhodoligotrophos appendicifer]|uniref:SDR family oxidoreductase n=1 Tax=Rhodoligotrophos appendicifer TaxID=987056 RepID=UPI0011865BA8|nr:SDR family oxidoreductase [Rhodoligotrophos appendicifer]
MTDEAGYGFSDADLAAYESAFRKDLFCGSRVLVTGGGSGLGKATAWLFGKLGAEVIISGRRIERLDEAAAVMRAHGLTARAIGGNIRSPEDVEALFEAAGDLDILINNAGGQFPQAAIDFSPKGWNAVIDTNLNGTWAMMQTAAKRWRETERGGTIVNIVTVVDRGMPGVAHTCAARAGVIGVTRTVAVEWAPLNIRINCIAPGAIMTEGMTVYSDEARESYKRSNPMMRFGDAFDIAEGCAYLAGPTGKFITGEVLALDGGGRLWGEFWAIPKPDYFK